MSCSSHSRHSGSPPRRSAPAAAPRRRRRPRLPNNPLPTASISPMRCRTHNESRATTGVPGGSSTTATIPTAGWPPSKPDRSPTARGAHPTSTSLPSSIPTTSSTPSSRRMPPFPAGVSRSTASDPGLHFGLHRYGRDDPRDLEPPDRKPRHGHQLTRGHRQRSSIEGCPS